MMANHPDKQLVRQYMAGRAVQGSPPPSPDQIKRELGWWLVPSNGPEPEVQDLPT